MSEFAAVEGDRPVFKRGFAFLFVWAHGHVLDPESVAVVG